MSKTLKVGLIQQTCSASVEDNKQKLAKNIADVAAQGAELVVLQELHNSLYFCQVETLTTSTSPNPFPVLQPTSMVLWPKSMASS